jgi:hypothetical protein
VAAGSGNGGGGAGNGGGGLEFRGGGPAQHFKGEEASDRMAPRLPMATLAQPAADGVAPPPRLANGRPRRRGRGRGEGLTGGTRVRREKEKAPA